MGWQTPRDIRRADPPPDQVLSRDELDRLRAWKRREAVTVDLGEETQGVARRLEFVRWLSQRRGGGR